MAGYSDDAAFNAWLTANGYTLPQGAPALGVLRHRGSEYVDAVYGARFAGSVADVSQERQWPRERAIVSGKLVPADVVPAAVVNASFHAAYQEALKPGSLSVVGSVATAVKRVKVGQIEKEYQAAKDDGSASAITPLISIVDGLLAPYLVDRSALGLGIWSVGC